MASPSPPESPIIVLGRPHGGLATIADRSAHISVATGVDEALELLAASECPVAVIVLTPELPRPLSAARRIRTADRLVQVAFLVPREDTERTQMQIALAPDIAPATVLDASEPPDILDVTLRTAADAASQRRRVRRALDTINRDIAVVDPDDTPEPSHRVSERYLAALTRHLPEALIAVDAEGRIVTINDAAAGLLAVEPEDADGAAFVDVLAADDPSELRALVEAAGRGETQDRDDLPVRRPDGTSALVSLTAAPVSDEHGRIAGLVILAHDVTEERRTADRLRELQKAESLATLAGGVAHDFNNLLVTIQSWASMAEEDAHDVELVVTALGHIQRTSRRAAALARSMLAYSGRGEFELGPTDVNAVVSDMAALLEASISSQVALAVELDGSLPAILADPTQLSQVVLNLVTNASEAIGEEPGTITIRTSSEDLTTRGDGSVGWMDELPTGRYVVLEVDDTGSGIENEVMVRIFDPFFSTKFAGRGLGLAATHGIVRAHGGGISIRSEPGDGACFRVYLPVADGRSPS